MKNYKNTSIVLAVSAGVLLIAFVFVGWKYMQLRKAVAKTATKTASPTTAATSAAVQAIVQSADAIV